MKKFGLRAPSPALLISVIALFVALGGTTYAATTALPLNSVGTPQLKNLAVTGPKIANSAVTALQLANNAVTNTKIANGAVTAAKINTAGLTVPNANAVGGVTAAQLQRTVSGTCNAGSAIRAVASNGTVTCQSTEPSTFFLGPNGFPGPPATQSTVVNGYTLTDSCSLSGSTATIQLSLSYSGGQFNFTGGGIKGSTPFSWEYNGYNGNLSNYTILTDSTTTGGSGHVEFEAGHYGSAANIIGQVGYGVHNEGSFALCTALGSIQPAQ